MTDKHRRPSMSGQFRQALHDLQGYAEYLQETGVQAVEMTPRPAAVRPKIPAKPPSSGGTNPGLEEIARQISACTRCPLHATRTRTVPGQGSPAPEILFIGEGPGQEEDRQGLAFVGRAGQLLTRLITAMGFLREQVFIANIVKCRPTVDFAKIKDRPPTSEEMEACVPYLHAQIAALRPKVIISLGNVATKYLLKTETGISRLHGTWGEVEGIPVMPTYHPSFLLRGGGDDTGRYWEVWDDMVKVLLRLGRTPPAKKRPGAATAKINRPAESTPD